PGAPSRSTLFPYTTLFRSDGVDGDDADGIVLALALIGRHVAPPPLDTQFDAQGGVLRKRGNVVVRVEYLVLTRGVGDVLGRPRSDRKSTRLNSSHVKISYA